MSKINKKHSENLKFKVAMEALKGTKTIAELCQEYGVISSQIYAWKKQVEENGAKIFMDKRAADQK